MRAKTRPPKTPRPRFRARVGVDENKSRKHEEKIDADVAEAGEVLIPPRSARQNAGNPHVEQHHVERRKKAQGGQRLEFRQGIGSAGHPG